MARPQPYARAPMLDLRSRRTVKEFSIQAGIGIAIMICLFAAGTQTWLELGQSAVRVFTFYSVIDCLRASHRRDQVWGGSLNRWDQAAAYGFCALLIDVVLKWSR